MGLLQWQSVVAFVLFLFVLTFIFRYSMFKKETAAVTEGFSSYVSEHRHMAGIKLQARQHVAFPLSSRWPPGHFWISLDCV